jgi:adenylate cyclase
MALEIELKLSFPSNALPELMQHSLIADAPREGEPGMVENTYFDTPKFKLKARKIALRLRQQDGITVQTVKRASASNGGLSRRDEWEIPWPGWFDFSAVADPVATVLMRMQDDLVPVFSTRFHRDTRRLQPRPGVCILAMIDTGLIEAGTQSVPIHELELELIEGSEEELFLVAATLRETLPLKPENVSKAQRGYRLALKQRSD